MRREFITLLGGAAAWPAATITQQSARISQRPTIPIVFSAIGDFIGTGLVASLNRLGGNVTGLGIEIPPTLLVRADEVIE